MPDPDCGDGGSLETLVCPRCGEPSQKIKRALTPCGAYLCLDCLIEISEGRREVSLKDLEQAVDFVMTCLNNQIKKKGRGRFVSTHEAIGVIQEEVSELHDAARANDEQQFRRELMDVAAASLFALAGFLTDTGKCL